MHLKYLLSEINIKNVFFYCHVIRKTEQMCSFVVSPRGGVSAHVFVLENRANVDKKQYKIKTFNLTRDELKKKITLDQS